MQSIVLCPLTKRSMRQSKGCGPCLVVDLGPALPGCRLPGTVDAPIQSYNTVGPELTQELFRCGFKKLYDVEPLDEDIPIHPLDARLLATSGISDPRRRIKAEMPPFSSSQSRHLEHRFGSFAFVQIRYR
jgi:hypothetical protein